jgi:hypothetical protein
MRRIIRNLKENKQDFIERVNIIMMNDFASEFMKTEDDKITISYFIFRYDLDYMVDIDYLFDWRTKERVDNWYTIDVTVNRDDWIAWAKARACENDWIILDKRQGIYNTTTGDFINGKECWNDDFLRQLKPKHLIRYILTNEIKQINADLRRLNSWINNSKDNGLKA